MIINEDIRNLEETAINAWPSLQTILMDGWVIRLADGYTRRANSVNPLYPSTQALKRKIEACEALFRSKGLRPVFKITPAALPQNLDSVLAGAGYEREARTSLLALELSVSNPVRESRVELHEAESQEWCRAFCLMNAIPPAHHETVCRLMVLQPLDKRLAVIRYEGKIAACGLGVRQGRFIGLFDIVVHPSLRRQGLGREIVNSLVSWGYSQGARTAYLQVMTDNAAALKLYAELGFREQYAYWYRVRQDG